MKDIMRKHLWPAALVAALAVVGMLAAFVVLTGPQRGTAEAQGICDTASGAALRSLIQAGICQASTATPAPTTGGSGPSSPGSPGSPASPAPATTPDVCAGATPQQLAALRQAGLCQPTATPPPTATPTPVPPTATVGPTPTPTATPQPPQSTNVGDTIESSSTTASAGVKLTLTIGNLPRTMEAGSSVELYLEDDFKVPDSIDRSSVYFTVTNRREAATSSGGRVYTTDAVEIDTDDHFGGDDDWAIQVFLPDFNTGDEFDGFNGPAMNQTLQLVILSSGGIKNPPEEGDHSVGYAVLGPNVDANDGPGAPTVDGRLANYYKKLDDVTDSGAPLRTNAKISLSDEDNTRGYELTVTGSGFNNGTSAAVHVLADDAVPQDLDRLVNGVDANNDGDTRDAGDTPPTAATKAQACSLILTQGQRAGIATVDSDDTVAVTFEVTVPIFKPGNQNFLCMVDGEGRQSKTDVEQFELEPSIRITPSSASVGDTINVHAQDFPDAAGLTSVKIANQVVWPKTAVDQRFPGNYAKSLRTANIGSDGSATVTFDMPGSVSGSSLEGTVRVDVRWGGTITAGTMTGGGTDSGGKSENANITLTGSALRLSVSETRANESVTIQGEGFGTSNTNEIAPADITIDGVQLLVDDDSLENGVVEVSSAGQFVATVYIWENTGEEDTTNPALTAGTHTIRVRDRDGFYGSASIVIKEPTMSILPAVLGPREYLTVTGTDWPVDNQDSTADTGNVEVEVESRKYTVIPDVTGRFTVRHRVSRDVAIPTTETVTASYKDDNDNVSFVKTASFEVPAATIAVSPTEGQPGDEVTLTVTGMPVYAEVDEITIGGARAGTSQDFRTDREGNVTAEGLVIPGLDPGTYSVVMKVGSGSSQTVAIGSLTVLTEGVAGAVAELPGALSVLGDNLEAVFYFDNISKEWSFYDPRDEFADLNTLSGLIIGEPYWILVGEAADEVVLNDNPRDLTCSNGDCWNLVVW